MHDAHTQVPIQNLERRARMLATLPHPLIRSHLHDILLVDVLTSPPVIAFHRKPRRNNRERIFATVNDRRFAGSPSEFFTDHRELSHIAPLANMAATLGRICKSGLLKPNYGTLISQVSQRRPAASREPFHRFSPREFTPRHRARVATRRR